jgi:hypothetical protein
MAAVGIVQDLAWAGFQVHRAPTWSTLPIVDQKSAKLIKYLYTMNAEMQTDVVIRG